METNFPPWQTCVMHALLVSITTSCYPMRQVFTAPAGAPTLPTYSLAAQRLCLASIQSVSTIALHAAGHTLSYPLKYLGKHLGNFPDKVKLQQVGGQKAREATPVSSPSSEQFNIVARAIYETVQPQQVKPMLGKTP